MCRHDGERVGVRCCANDIRREGAGSKTGRVRCAEKEHEATTSIGRNEE